MTFFCVPVFAEVEAPVQEGTVYARTLEQLDRDIIWSRGLSDGTVIEELDAEGNYYFHCPSGSTLSSVIGYFCSVYDLDESNFAIAYDCPSTGESYAFNQDTYMLAASTYKLPLNMYYYEQEAAGVYGSDTYVGGYDLDEAHYLSIVWSDNYVSESMIYYLGSYHEYKTLMNEYYGQLPDSMLTDEYWSNNYYTVRFMMNTLKVLYNRMDEFAELLGYMLEAFQDYDLALYAGDVPVAHKVGDFEGYWHDVGITFTAQPFLIAVFTYNVDMPSELIGRINVALMDYQRVHSEDLQRTEEEARLAEEQEAQRLEKAAEEARLAEEQKQVMEQQVVEHDDISGAGATHETNDTAPSPTPIVVMLDPSPSPEVSQDPAALSDTRSTAVTDEGIGIRSLKDMRWMLIPVALMAIIGIGMAVFRAK